tara:strand:- start:36461 stop:36955 length:495 start_codon:yes stop_codon:yes gene_type:complete
MQLTPIAGYEGRYSITRTGEVYSLPYTRCDGKRRKGLWLRAATSRYGYKMVVLTKPDKSRHSLSIHRLVATTFLGDGTGLQVNHKNGIKIDNSVDNLEWCTQRENMQHAHKTGLINHRGLTPSQVWTVKDMLSGGYKQTVIGKTLGIESSLISKIKTGLIYKDI